MIEAPRTGRTFLRRLFLSPSESRLRAGWRLLLQTVLMYAAAILGAILIVVPLLLLGLTPDLFTGEVVEFLLVTGSVLLARKYLDRRSFLSLGLGLDRAAIAELLAGILITGLMMGAIFLSETALGWIRLEAFAWQAGSAGRVLSGTALSLVTFVLVAWNEELLFRGYRLQNLAAGTNLPLGVLLSSAWFGIEHLGNPFASWVSTAGIALSGLFLAYGCTRTGRLWLPIGLHLGWNFFEGTVFGFPVSGLDIYRLLRTSQAGPGAWTGGPFGPEAGLIMLPALVLGSALIYLYSRFRRSKPADSAEIA